MGRVRGVGWAGKGEGRVGKEGGGVGEVGWAGWGAVSRVGWEGKGLGVATVRLGTSWLKRLQSGASARGAFKQGWGWGVSEKR